MRTQLADTAIRLARRGPVLVTGIAGIGKSWFLRMIAQRGKLGAFPCIDLLDGARPDAPGRLEEHLAELAQPEPRRLLLVDAVEFLLASRAPVLDTLACSRAPILLAAPPSVGELAAAAPRLQAFLESRCRALILPPLSPPERRDLLFPTTEPRASISPDLAPLALDPTWGGHPRVLQQLRGVLQDPTQAALGHLDEAVSARLPGHADAVLSSLPTPEREALLAAARGEPMGEHHRGAALSLVLHGVFNREADGWTIADRVLAFQLGARRGA